jgi:DNA adenine methylase
MDYYSPLRYPGGKGEIATFFKQIFKDNFLYDGVYIEPYAGGASVALSLLLNEYASKIIINDIDPTIYAFWHSVLFSTDKLCRLIKDTPVNLDVWKIQREIQKRNADVSTVQLGFSTFFLNRTNRSGIINAGVIGGVNQNGKWKIDARYNKSDLIKRIKRIASHKDRITILNLDACQLISRVKKTVSTKSLFYLDPPYYAKGKELYLNYYNDGDHFKVAKGIKQLNNHKWIITYDNTRFIRKLYSEFRQIKYTVNYTARTFSKGQEIMIFSNNLYLPSLNPKSIVAHHLT